MINFDHRLDGFVVHHRAEPFDTFFVFLSRIGSLGIVWILIAAAITFAWRRPTVLPLVLIAEVLGEVSSGLLKQAIDRPRPNVDALMSVPHNPSLPSGHATTSFACAATLARFVSRRVAAALFVLAALIAWSRVYVGAHYPLDIVAGAVLGLAIATALRPLPEVRRRLRQGRRSS